MCLFSPEFALGSAGAVLSQNTVSGHLPRSAGTYHLLAVGAKRYEYSGRFVGAETGDQSGGGGIPARGSMAL